MGKLEHRFEVGQYPHHDWECCKYRVFENGSYLASFEPDAQAFLHISQNPGNVEEQLLHLLADKIEKHHPPGINENIKS
ncbi:hypothetical protein GCM10023149_21610 [Mucilaginibacter gynuensis]|uniref:Uncharacterized protein n=2 Tax=Mucilaginibacter gynuensis TaxID=1302236 RepID=A0ABP8GCB5_9SPHI